MSLFDRIKRELQRLVAPLQFRLDYTRYYPASVVSQNADGSLELRSSVPQLESLSKVVIAYGVPGISVTVASGGEVLVGFQSADPKQPYVVIHDQAVVTSLAILGGTKPVARLGDGFSVNLPVSAAFAGTVTTGSGPTPFAGPATMANPFAGVIDTGQNGALA